MVITEGKVPVLN